MKKEEPQFISLAEAAKMTNYSQDYISLLCRQGKLQAQKLGRNWVTTKDWVYSYVDNTEGKGESVVAVKVKEKKAADEKPAEAKAKTKVKAKKPFFSYSALECALFCFASMIWSINVYAFTTYLQEGDFDFSDDYATTSLVNTHSSAQKAKAAQSADAASCSAGGTCSACASQDGLASLDAFDPETDADTITSVKADIATKFGKEVDVQVYKKFAVLNYTSNPDMKYLYPLDK